MKTRDRLLAVDASAPGWRAGLPELPPQDVTLMRLLRVASLGITACVDPLLRPAGLTESSYHTLVIVMAGGTQGITPTVLCDQVGQGRANMTRILFLLESEKLVATRSDARDGRRKRIVVTAAGRRLVQHYAGTLAPVVAAAMKALGPQDKRQLEKLLRALVESMDAAEQALGRTS